MAKLGLTCHACEGPMVLDYWDNGDECWMNPDSGALHCKRIAPNRFLLRLAMAVVFVVVLVLLLVHDARRW